MIHNKCSLKRFMFKSIGRSYNEKEERKSLYNNAPDKGSG